MGFERDRPTSFFHREVSNLDNITVNGVIMEQTLGEKVEYKIRHHDHIIYVGEVGNNTCQKDDGMKDDQKYFVARGTQSRKGCLTSDVHWTNLGFIAVTGEPILCVIIFAYVDC